MVTRWREANLTLTLTEQDCVRRTIVDIAEVMGKRDMPLSEVSIRTGHGTALLLFKKDSVG